MKASPINGHCCNVQVIERGLVSVIIPTYNRADLICQTLDSVVSQTYSRYEIIVVDDGSDDNTTEVLASWQERTEDNCLQVFTAQHFGAPAARNLGLRKSRGEYIQYLDSDDLLLPGKLSDQVSYLEKHADAAAV
jgi:glycosyltransferase involved in cell wall biosynthesis